MGYLATVTTDVQAIVKNYYSARYEDLTFGKRPLLTALPKATDGGGDTYVQAVQIGGPAGTATQFATAKANTTNVVRKKFVIDWKELHTVTQVMNTPIELAKGNKRAIVDYITGEVNKSWDEHSNKLENLLFNSGYGEIGTISAISGSTFTLTDRTNHINFKIGMKVVLAASLSGAALRNSGATLTVAGVNRATGVITTSVAVTTGIAAAAVGDVVFVQGDRQDSATPTLYSPAGLAGWLPITRPTAGDSFYGVDRSVDTEFLAGAYVDGRGKSITESINDTLARASELEADPDIIVMHFANVAKLIKESQNKLVLQEFNGRNVKPTFRGIEIPGPNGSIKVVSAARCPTDRYYTLTSDTWKITTVGDMIRNPLRTGEMMDLESSDGAEIRNKTIWAFACSAPGRNAVTQIA